MSARCQDRISIVCCNTFACDSYFFTFSLSLSKSCNISGSEPSCSFNTCRVSINSLFTDPVKISRMLIMLSMDSPLSNKMLFDAMIYLECTF